MSDELEAIAQRYARRPATDRYSLLRPDVWQTVHERQRALLRLLRRLGWGDLPRRRLLEVGCGSGANLLEMLRLGFVPQHLAGIELLPERHAEARRLLPDAVRLWLGDATALDAIEPASQDMVLAATVFSSLFDDAFQQQLAAKMWRWVKPGGGVLWYDLAVNNPRNADVRGVPLVRVRELFPAGRVTHRRVTLAAPLARVACRLHPALYRVFNTLPVLRTHVLAWIEKPA